MKEVSTLGITMSGLGFVVLLAITSDRVEGQSSPPPAGSWSVTAGVEWLELNGTRRLVRGTRKVVTTDASSGMVPFLEVAIRLNDRLSLTLGARSLDSDYEHVETFTNGHLIETSDELSLDVFTAGLRRGWGLGHQTRVSLDAYVAYLRFNERLNLMSEQQVPADVTTINPTPFDLTVFDDVGLGLGVDAEVPLGSAGLYLNARVNLTIGFMSADIVNDPEDPEDGRDVNSPMHPLGVGVGVRYRFGR